MDHGPETGSAYEKEKEIRVQGSARDKPYLRPGSECPQAAVCMKYIEGGKTDDLFRHRVQPLEARWLCSCVLTLLTHDTTVLHSSRKRRPWAPSLDRLKAQLMGKPRDKAIVSAVSFRGTARVCCSILYDDKVIVRLLVLALSPLTKLAPT